MVRRGAEAIVARGRLASMSMAMLVACKPVEPAPARPGSTGAVAPRLERFDPQPHQDDAWAGYAPEVEAEFARARALLGDELDGWTLGSLAPALLDWVEPGASRTVWMSIDGAPCKPAIIRRPDEPAEAEVDVALWAKFDVEETVDNGVRQRSFQTGAIGHEVTFGNGGGTEQWDGERWVEVSGYGVGEPPDEWGTLSSVNRDVARFEAPSGRPVVECDSPRALPCGGGGRRLCPSCDRLRVIAIHRWRNPVRHSAIGGLECSDPCPPRGPDHPELPFLRRLLQRYGGFQTPAGGTTSLMFRDQARCRAEVPTPERAEEP